MSEFRYPQPSNEYAFEDFCLVLMREVWSLPTLEQFGHRGERQHGVDLLDLGDAVELRGVQCKHHEAHKTLPPAELEAEVAKALTLPDEPLAEYWVLTTAKKSTQTQRRVREINKLHRTKGLFRVVVKFWDDVERMIDASPAARSHLELRAPDAVIAAVRSAVNDVITPVTLGALHVGLDEAKAHLAAGELSESLLVLRKVRSHVWPELSAAQKARWLTLRADIAFRQGRDKDAAAQLLEALDQTPDDEMAIVNAVSAKRLLDDDGAAALAQQARERFPSSASAWAAGIAAAKTAADAAALAEGVPTHLRESAEVLLAIASRPDLHDRFPGVLDRAVAIAPDDVRGWFHLGLHLLAAEARKLDPGSWDDRAVDKSRVARAVEALSKAEALCIPQARATLRAEVLLHRAAARSLLGEMTGVRADIELANSIEPSSPHVSLARAQLHLEEGSLSSAIPLLRERHQREPGAHDTDLMLASALWNRNESGDRDESTGLMVARAARGDDPSGVADFMALDGMLAARRFTDATEFVAQSTGRLGATEHAVLEGRLFLASEDRARAGDAAGRALASLPENPSRRQVAWVGRLLVQVGRYQDAMPILRRLSDDVRDLDSVRAFVLCASRLDRHADVLAACERSRGAGTYDPYLLSVELPLLHRHDPNRAIAVLEAVLARDPSLHGARVNLALVAQRMDREDIVEREINHLPLAADVSDPEEGAAVVQILGARDRSADAVAYAYDLLRRFFASPHAHRAFIHSVLWREHEEQEAAESPARVAPGLAVCLREIGDREDRWFVLEDSSVPAGGVEHELLPANDLWTRLVGRAVGDEIDLASGPGLSRKARITTVLPKITFRFQDAMNRWQYRFPEHQELWMVRVADDETGKFDPSRFIEIAKAQRERVEHVETVFRSQLVPTSMLGRALGKDAFRAALHVATTPGLPMRCCTGSVEERDAAFVALDSATEIVVDGTALATLYLLDLLGVMREVGKRLLVPHTVMSLVRAFMRDAKTTERATAAMGATAAGPVLHVYTPDEKTALRNNAEAFKSALDQRTVVSPTIECATMTSGVRDRLVQVLDEPTLDAIAVGSAPGRVLWTDDFVVAQLARGEAGASTVWTQGLLLWMLQRGLLNDNDYTRASARLVGLDYTFTSLSPVIVSESARTAEWSPHKWPLKQTIDQFGKLEVRPRDAAQLGALLVREAFTEPLPVELRDAVLFAVCTALSSRTDGVRALEDFEHILPRIFGLNVVGERQAMQAMSVWKQPPKLVLPGVSREPA